MVFFQQPLSKSIMILQEAGILKKFYSDELSPPVNVPLPRYKFDQPIDLSMMLTPLIFMAAGLFLALLTFIGEYCRGGKQVTVSLN